MSTLNFKPIQGRRIKFAVVGCGRISERHFTSILEHKENVELVGVCDINENLKTAHENKYKVPGYLSLDEMLEKCDADIYSLCTPSGIHSEQTIQIAKHKKHILCEKPMATYWEDGLKMVRACEENNVNCFIVKQNRFNSTLQLLRGAIDEGRFGKMYMVNINVFWQRPQEYYDQAKWRGTRKLDGGALMNQASHYVDLADWMFGPIETVYSNIATLGRKIETEDTAIISLKCKSGALGSINVTMLTYPKNLEGSITVIGENGTVKISGVALNKIETWEFADNRASDVKIRDHEYSILSVYGFGHPTYYKNVIDVLRGDAKPSTDGYSGLKSLEILIAAYESAKTGTATSLPLSRDL